LTIAKQLFYDALMSTPLEIAVDLAGGQTKLANEIARIAEKPITQAHIWNWINRADGLAPPEYCAAIEQVVQRKVTRKELRPNDWKKIWPELAEAA
jgi:DNA-binding transcriptional regulator YdaS (Cro superfamily)